MKNKKYWEKRTLSEALDVHKSALDIHKKQVVVLKNTENEIKQIINKYINNIAKDNSISISEAQSLLNKKEKEELNWILKDYVLFSKKYEQYINKDSPEAIALDLKLKNASKSFRIRKNDALLLEVKKELVKLGVEENKVVESHLENIMQTTRDNYNLPKIPHSTKPDKSLKKLSENFKTVEEALNEKWIGNKNFSQRIWKDVDRLNKMLEEELPKSISRGDGGKRLIAKLERSFNTSASNAKRLVHTESFRIYSKTRIKSFEDLGVEKVELLATLDLKTSKICQNKDQKIVELKGATIGIDLPPFHPHCRTVFVAIFDDKLEEQLTTSNGRKARDPIDNKSYTTGIKDYKQWKNSKSPKVNSTISQVHKDRYLDKRNYKKFKKVLKNQDYFPNTLAEYRKMRYNNVEEHKELLNTYDNKLEYQNFMKTFKRHQVPKEYLPKDFEEFNNIKKNILNDSIDNVLKYEKLKFRNKILKEKEQGKQKLHKGHQNKHQLNSNEYISARDKGNPRVYKSYLLKNGDPMENNKKEYYSYVEELYKEAAGRGELIIDTRKTIPEIKEYYKFNRIIGKSNLAINKLEKRPVPPENFNYKNTSIIQIKYSSRGYHVVPIDDKEE